MSRPVHSRCGEPLEQVNALGGYFAVCIYCDERVTMSRFNTDWLREVIGERFVGGREDFDSWLAEVERVAAEKAWDEGNFAESYNRSQVENMRAGVIDAEMFESRCKRNPYRNAVQS